MRVRSMDAFVTSPQKRRRQINRQNNIPVEAEVVPALKKENVKQPTIPGEIKKIISSFAADDYILIGLIAVLIFESCDDYVLLAALGYLFIMGIV